MMETKETKETNVTTNVQPEIKEQFDAMMQKGYDDAQAGIGLPVDEAFKKVREVL